MACGSTSGKASVIITGIMHFTWAAAMPLPMIPTPITPTDAIGRGAIRGFPTPASFLFREVSKKEFISPRLVGVPNCWAAA